MHVGVYTDIIIILTSRITMSLIHKIFDHVQVAIGTGQKEWGVTIIIWL